MLLDLTLPQRGGADLRAIRPDVPVVIMSGFERRFILAEIGAEVAGVLSRPLDAEALRTLLRAVLEDR